MPVFLRDIWDYLRALVNHWAAVLVGIGFTLGFGVVPALRGAVVAPWIWALAIVLAVLPASFLAWRDSSRSVDKLEAENRARKRAEEAKDFNVPRGFRRGELAFQRALFAAQTPLGLLPESNAELNRLVEKAIASLDRDCLYIINREKLAETFGPFAAQRGRYGRLPWADAHAEMAKLLTLGISRNGDCNAG